LQRFLPPEVARSVIEGVTPIQAGQQLCRLTCFRLELRGFDEMVEQAEPIVAPEDMATMLNAYLSEMMEVAFAHGATVDKFIRDTVVGFFGAPKSQGAEQDAVRCAKMAKKMWERAMEVCQRWQRFIDLPPPQPTLVLSSGHATVGNFGSSTRLEYTAMGGPVDETTALLPAVEPGSVACSQATWILVKDSVTGEPEGEVKLRGGSRSVKLYRIAGPHETVARDPDATRTTLDRPSSFVARQPPQELCKGMVLAKRYEIVRPLGEGGMGTVYKARDLKLSSDVALKLLKHDMFSDDSRRARIYREVKLAQLVSHRNVARIYDLQAWEGFEFISMEFIQGQTLAERLEASGAFSTEEGCDVLRQICAGLAAAHAANIIHRDLKPSNIMLEEGGRVVIMDFGTAVWDSALQETISKEKGVVGSPYYMAPEQFEDRQVDQRADIYALGVVAYEMFTGQVPFDAKNILSLAFKHTSQPPPDPLSIRPDLSMRLSAVILRCLEKTPARRFGSAVEVASLL
jgi:serine/threonine-protein kinase